MINVTPSLVNQVERNAAGELLCSYQENVCLEKNPADEYVLDDKKYLKNPEHMKNFTAEACQMQSRLFKKTGTMLPAPKR
ncbi:MAG: hypothetical protein HYY43_00225 [Deltaproteobacteria bacterium]|nr:hypothetical protein [Deltaproteobacteria bacterium]